MGDRGAVGPRGLADRRMHGSVAKMLGIITFLYLRGSPSFRVRRGGCSAQARVAATLLRTARRPGVDETGPISACRLKGECWP